MSFEPISNIENLKNLVAYQYSESTNYLDLLEVLITPFDELEQVFTDIINYRLLDTASTDALDTIGSILGQSRVAYDTTVSPFFGLDAANPNLPVLHYGLGDLNDQSMEGGIFRSIDQPISTIAELENGAYRDVLKGKAARNNYKGGVEELISIISYLFGFYEKGSFQVKEVFDDPTDPYVDIIFYKQLTAIQKAYLYIMNILPKPGGIRYEYTFSGLKEIGTTDGFRLITGDGRVLNTQLRG